MDASDFLETSCVICNRRIDICLISQSVSGDGGMACCGGCGKHICLAHLQQPDDKEKWDYICSKESWIEKPTNINDLEDYWDESSDEYWSELKPAKCPYCMKRNEWLATGKYAKVLYKDDRYRFLMRLNGFTEKKLQDAIVKQCPTHEDFIKFIKGK